MILNYDFGKGNFKYDADDTSVSKKVISLLTSDMLSSYCNKNKITDNDEIQKAREIIAFTFENYDFGIDEFIEWEEHYRSELEDIFYDKAYDVFRYGDD